LVLGEIVNFQAVSNKKYGRAGSEASITHIGEDGRNVLLAHLVPKILRGAPLEETAAPAVKLHPWPWNN
jgi:hypothetical protein